MKKERRKTFKWVLAVIFLLNCVVSMVCTASAASSVRLNSTTKSLYKGQVYTLKVYGTKKKIKWKSSNSKVVKVNSAGRITAKKAGNAVITAKFSGGSLRCQVKVINPSIKLNRTSVSLSMPGTNTIQLKATVKGPNSKVTWKSSNKKIATVFSAPMV